MAIPFYNKEAKYAPLSDTHGSTDDVSSDGQLHERQLLKNRQVPWRNSWFIFSSGLNVFSLIVFCLLGFSQYREAMRLNPELRQCSTYCKSPCMHGYTYGTKEY